MSERTVNVLFVCAAGMSSSLIKSKTLAASAERGLSMVMDAIPLLMVKPEDFAGRDVVVVAPQVRGQMSKVKSLADPLGIPVGLLGFQEYGLADTAKILALILELVASKEEEESS